jgi:hypothetical protein
VRNNKENLKQVVRAIWQSPRIETYSDSFVGYPELLINNGSNSKKTTLTLGSNISFFPIARFCLGCTDEIEDFRLQNPSCVQSSKIRPFGSIISKKGFERCKGCNEKSKHIDCIYKKPKCDGSQIRCKKEFFAGNICNGNFSVYISIFGDVLKIGRSILSRTIARLLEQSAYDALVFYPVNSLTFADFLENETKKYLRSKLRHLRPYGIHKVKKSVTVDERFTHIKTAMAENKKNTRDHIYDKVKALLAESKHPHIQALMSSEQKRVKLERNWFLTSSLNLSKTVLVTDLQFKKIGGEINGIIGSFLFINGKAYSLKSIQGCVMEWP